MNWLENHKQSQTLVAKAETASRRGELDQAQSLYREAAEFEALALEAVPTDKPRTYDATVVSVVALFFKAHEWDSAQTLAYRYLGSERQPDQYAISRLEDLLASIKYRKADIDTSASVMVSAKGGQIMKGGAPLDLVVSKTKSINSLLYRTAEYIRGIPHRKRGGPVRDISAAYQSWILQKPPGSYQFSLAIAQTGLLDSVGPITPPHDIIRRFIEIIQICAESPFDGLRNEIKDDEYASTFLKSTRDLAPTPKGKFSQLDLRGRSTKAVSLRSENRDIINEAIKERAEITSAGGEVAEIYGVLRALHLDRDWIEIAKPEGDGHYRIDGAQEEVDDRIGPMVNHPVVVSVVKTGNKLHFVDINIEEDR